MLDDAQNGNQGTEDEEEISWEDAFAEAAAGQGQHGVHESMSPGGGMSEPLMAPTAAVPAGLQQGAIDLDFLLDIALEVTVEIGRKKILINDLLQLQQGSVITLDKMVGESFEVYVNGKIMAYGEVVMINEKFGIRLTDIVDPRERIERLS
jgi:flagellar motor switch protein FliN/FliY